MNEYRVYVKGKGDPLVLCGIDTQDVWDQAIKLGFKPRHVTFVRELVTHPHLLVGFDFFNDYKDTLSFLEWKQRESPSVELEKLISDFKEENRKWEKAMFNNHRLRVAGIRPLEFPSHDEFCKYVDGLQVGERVIETEPSCCMFGRKGDVYISQNEGPAFGSKCVLWEAGENDKPKGRMGTSVTHGTRRISDVQ